MLVQIVVHVLSMHLVSLVLREVVLFVVRLAREEARSGVEHRCHSWSAKRSVAPSPFHLADYVERIFEIIIAK